MAPSGRPPGVRARHGVLQRVRYRQGVDAGEFVPGVDDLHLIGRGGTAAVFRSRDRITGESVAVKVLHVRLTAADEIARFERDLAAASQLTGTRSIVPIRSFGVNNVGHPWVVTDDLPRSLADVLREQPRLPWAEAAAIGTQIADALDAAHALGVLHADLTPGDVRFDDRGVPHLADLGLARFAGVAGVPATSADARLSHTAPELAANQRIDARTDVYSLASVLYEAMAGRPPLGRIADHGADALVERIQSTPPDSLTRFGVPPSVDHVILGALAKDPADRPASARAFADALAAAVRIARATVVTRRPGELPSTPTPTLSTAPFMPEETPFDELATPPHGYPMIEDVPVLDPETAAPLLAAAGRRERRRRRERLVAKIVGGLVIAGALAGLVIWLVVRDRPDTRIAITPTTTAGTTTTDVTPGTDALRPVGTIGYAFTASFDTREGEAAIVGVASPTGEARLKNVLLSVGRLSNDLDIEDGPEPDEGAAVADAVTLIAAMRRDLVAGVLRFDGETFSMSGFYTSPDAVGRLADVIALIRTPVARPDLNPDPSATTATAAPDTTAPTGLTISAEPAVFSIPADGRLHVIPLTLRPSTGASTLCLVARSVSGGSESSISMTHSSCGLAHLVTISVTTPGTYLVTGTFAEGVPNDQGDINTTTGPSGTVTFTVVAT